MEKTIRYDMIQAILSGEKRKPVTVLKEMGMLVCWQEMLHGSNTLLLAVENAPESFPDYITEASFEEFVIKPVFYN